MSARLMFGLRLGLSKHSSVVRHVPWPSTWMAPPSSTNDVRYRSAPSTSNTFCATSSSRSQGKYKPPSRPPQALNDQSTPRRRPLASMTKVGPQSRIHASLLLISTTRALSAKRARAFWNCAAETPTVTGSPWAMAAATAANTACAGLAPPRQLSVRSGQSIQQPVWRSNSAGMRKPSFAGVDVSVRNALSPVAHASIAAKITGAMNVRREARARSGSRRRREDHDRERSIEGAGPAHHPIHRGRRHRPRYLAREREGIRRGGTKSLRRKAQDSLDGGVRRREGQQGVQHVAARRNRHRLPRLSDLDQGSAHHT